MSTCHCFADNIHSVHSYPMGMSFLSNFTYSKLMQTVSFTDMKRLDMLTAREQLMEDIISIVDEYDIKKGFATKDELAEFLCDAVCFNFPS